MITNHPICYEACFAYVKEEQKEWWQQAESWLHWEDLDATSQLEEYFALLWNSKTRQSITYLLLSLVI